MKEKSKRAPTTIEQRRRWNKAYRERKLLGLVGKGKKKSRARALKQREYNKKYYAKMVAAKRAPTNGSGESNGSSWVLDKGIPVPEYTFASHEDHPGHLRINISAVVPHHRAMSILHMLDHQAPEKD